MNCDEMRPFWVSWNRGYIEVGRGNLVGDQRIVAWQDPEPMGIDKLRCDILTIYTCIPVLNILTPYHTIKYSNISLIHISVHISAVFLMDGVQQGSGNSVISETTSWR